MIFMIGRCNMAKIVNIDEMRVEVQEMMEKVASKVDDGAEVEGWLLIAVLDTEHSTNLMLAGESDPKNTAFMAGKLNHIMNDNFDRGEM